MRRLPGIALLLLLSAPAGGQTAGPKATLALVGGQIVDGFEGRPIPDGVVLIAGERILAVGPRSELAVPAGTPTIDTRGMTVLPGLADMHVHLMIVGHGAHSAIRHQDVLL